MVAAMLLGVVDIVFGIVAISRVDPASQELWNHICQFWGMGVPTGFSLVLFILVLYWSPSLVTTEKWLFFRISVFVCIGISILLPAMPLAVITLMLFIKWTRQEMV